MFIRLYNAVKTHFAPTNRERRISFNTYSFQTHQIVPNLHLNAVFLKDIYMTAEVVLIDLFAHIDHPRPNLWLYSSTDKPFKYDLFSERASRFLLKTFFTILYPNINLITNDKSSGCVLQKTIRGCFNIVSQPSLLKTFILKYYSDPKANPL